jgi:hypothetical protein
MLKHLILNLVAIAISQPVFASVSGIRSEFNCEVTYQNYIDTRNYLPQSFTGYNDAHGVGDFLTLSILLDSDVTKNTGVGFHILLTDEKRSNTVFSALTNARENSSEYPEVGTYNFDERGIGSKSLLDERIVYRKSRIYADGKAWGFMPLKSGKATLALVPVGEKKYRGTLSVAPAPHQNIYMFEFSQLECTSVIDSLENFLEYYSN